MRKNTLCLLCFIFVFSKAGATVFYVDPVNGSDTNDGLSWPTAVKSFAQAKTIANANAGLDDIYVKGGTFSFTGSMTFAEGENTYGSFKGDETSYTQRPLSDNDGNGIIEPWEFTYPTILSSTYNEGTAFAIATDSKAINGFSFTHSATNSNSATTLIAINISATSATFENNIIKNCVLSTIMGSKSINGVLFRTNGTVSNCLIENNQVTSTIEPAATTVSTVIPGIHVLAGTYMNGCVIRNNFGKVDLSMFTTIGKNNANIRGFIMHIMGATAAPFTTVSNCLVYNNESIYIGNSIAGTTSNNGSTIVLQAASTGSGNDYLINCTIANNKTTNMSPAAGVNSIKSGSFVHYIYNNVFWNNQLNGAVKNLQIGTSLTSGMVSNNVMNGGAVNITAGTNVQNNLTDLSDANTGTNSPKFTNPTSTVGNTTNLLAEQSIWVPASGSYLLTKGAPTSTTNNLRDKADIAFAPTPSAGAYEYIYFRSKATGNWNDNASWETSPDNSTWNTTISNPSRTYAAGINIASGHTITAASNATASALTVNARGRLTLENGYKLKASTLTLESDANGTATFVDKNASDSLIVSGTTSVQQHLAGGRNWYLSSPVSGATTAALSTATMVYSYDEPNAQFTTETASLTTGKGYISVTGATGAITFTGTLNSGTKTIPLTRTTGKACEGFNLIGNPYASYADWESAIKTNVSPTIWYRTKDGGNLYKFDTYNALDHLGTNNNGSGAVTGMIPPMQAVWVRVDPGFETGSVEFNNSMRLHATGAATPMKIKSANSDQQVLRLQVSDGVSNDEAIVLFNSNASNNLDEYDSEKRTNNNAAIPEIYTISGNKNVVINGLNSIESAGILPLGFTTGQANTFRIKAIETDNFDNKVSIILRDNLLNTEQDLTTGQAYTFSSDVTNTEDRFTLVFRTPSVSSSLIDKPVSNVKAYVNGNRQIVICTAGNFKAGDNATVFNSTGQKVMHSLLTNTTTTLNRNFQPGIYLVTLEVNGCKKTEKITL